MSMVPGIRAIAQGATGGGGGGGTPTVDPPIAVDDAAVVDQDQVLTVAAPGVLGNDYEPQGAAMTAVLVTGPTFGVLTLSEDGSYTYTPNAGFAGTDSFTYQASNGTVQSGPATVIITVEAPPPPIAEGPSDVSGFASSLWVINGSATKDSDTTVTLTPAARDAQGDVFYNVLVPTAGLRLAFSSYVGGGTGANGFAVGFIDPSETNRLNGAYGLGGLIGHTVRFLTWDWTIEIRNNDTLLKMVSVASDLRGTSSWVVTVTDGLLTLTRNGAAVLSQAVSLPESALVAFGAETTSWYSDIHRVSNVVLSHPA